MTRSGTQTSCPHSGDAIESYETLVKLDKNLPTFPRLPRVWTHNTPEHDEKFMGSLVSHLAELDLKDGTLLLKINLAPDIRVPNPMPRRSNTLV